MKNIILIYTFLFSFTSFAADTGENCISANCDVYRAERAIFQGQLAAIHCQGMGDVNKECNQIQLAKITKEFEQKINSIFGSKNATASIRNDIQFNSLTNLFTLKTQTAPGYYEIVPVLDNPNIGVHWGGVVNNMPDVDRIVNIDPNSPDVKKSKWYLSQWKKEAPLMLSGTRKDPIIQNSSMRDAYLGKPLYEINSPLVKTGTETSLYIFKNPVDNSNVFEIVGRNGWLNNVGGSNVFLTGEVVDTTHNNFDSGLYLTFNGKVSKLKANYYDSSKETKNTVVVGTAFAAFTAYHIPTKTSMFVQIAFADTRNENFTYNGCYMHGDSVEIVYTHNLDNDFVGKAAADSSGLVPKKYDLNKYLCDALKGNYSCPAGKTRPDFAGMSKDLKNWRFTGYYTGVETQAAQASASNQELPGPVKGDVVAGLQYSNMRVTSNQNESFANCDSILNKPEAADPVSPLCSKGTFKSGTQTIEYSCGCGIVAGGKLQADGCYHKAINGASTPDLKPVASPVADPLKDGASQGTFCTDSKMTRWICNDGPKAGWSDVGSGCFHLKTEDACNNELPVSQDNNGKHGNFCSGSKITKWSCNEGPKAGWSDVGGGCYHLGTSENCSN